MKSEPKEVVIYTDGGASPNPGKGGFAYVMLFGEHRKEFSQGFQFTTNNRMELMAVVGALESIKQKKYPIILYSDSKYIVDAVNKKWVENWELKGYKKVKNPDLWKKLFLLIKELNVEFRWVKGHAGVEFNERCDQMVAEAMRNMDLKRDTYFEQQSSEANVNIFENNGI